MDKRKLKIGYSCSDYCKHIHKWYLTARICGKIQEVLTKIRHYTKLRK